MVEGDGANPCLVVMKRESARNCGLGSLWGWGCCSPGMGHQELGVSILSGGRALQDMAVATLIWCQRWSCSTRDKGLGCCHVPQSYWES